MAAFEDRQKGFEKKFTLDAELKFKSESRRNRMLAEWAAGKLGLSDSDVDDYIKAVRRADLAEKGDEDVVRKVKADFDAKGLSVAETEIRDKLSAFLADAVLQIENERK